MLHSRIPPTLAVTLLGSREKRQSLCLEAILLACAVSNQQASYRTCCNKERLVKGEGMSKFHMYLSKNEN